MSRTIRNIAYSCVCARKIHYRNQFKNSVAWVEEMRDLGYEPRNRDKNMARKQYLNGWDDYSVSGWYEMSYINDLIDEQRDYNIGTCRWQQWETIADRIIKEKSRK